MTDQLDQPEEHAMELAVPFVVCRTQGGTYDDDAFVAGFQCGEIDRALLAASTLGAETVRFPMVRTDLIRQLELCAMNRGYPFITAEASDEWPEWSDVAFSTTQSGAETETRR